MIGSAIGRRLTAGLRGIVTALAILYPAFAPATPAPDRAPRGWVDVRDFGARGDGRTDDTAAIRAAIASLPPFDRKQPFALRPVYFPDGTYLVSDTLERRDADGAYAPSLALIGQSRNGTVLRLKDRADGYGDPAHPRAVLFYASGLMGGPPGAGGKDYVGKGEGNDGYQNYLENLTVDVGRGNPGAIAVDYLGNNIGAIRNVRLTAADGHGATGLHMRRKWTGPCLIQDVAVDGFAIGIDLLHILYSVVMDRVSVRASTVFALRNEGNVISFTDLTLAPAGGVGLANTAPASLVVGRGLAIEGEARRGIVNRGYMNLVDVAPSPLTTALGLPGLTAGPASHAGRLGGVFSPEGRIGEPIWRLPVERPPTQPRFAEADVADVADFGAVADGSADATAAINAAFRSGRPAVRFANGTYRITAPIVVPPSVRRIEGAFASIRPDMAAKPGAEPGQRPTASVFVVAQNSRPLEVDRLIVDNARQRAGTAFELAGGGGLVLRDIAAGAITSVDRSAQGGKLWIDDITGAGFRFAGRAGVWIRQLNTEGKGIRVQNRDAPLWVLGSKTENNMTLIENTGGTVELFGGYAYMVHATGDRVPYLLNHGGILRAALAEQAYFPETAYDTWLQSDAPALVRPAADFPLRGRYGRMLPQVTTE